MEALLPSNLLLYEPCLASSSRPNITGTANDLFGLTATETIGALMKSITRKNLAGYTGNGAQYGNLSFDAQSDNAIYGKSNLVQPAALKALACIKF